MDHFIAPCYLVFLSPISVSRIVIQDTLSWVLLIFLQRCRKYRSNCNPSLSLSCCTTFFYPFFRSFSLWRTDFLLSFRPYKWILNFFFIITRTFPLFCALEFVGERSSAMKVVRLNCRFVPCLSISIIDCGFCFFRGISSKPIAIIWCDFHHASFLPVENSRWKSTASLCRFHVSLSLLIY